MIAQIKRILSIPELKEKITFTIVLLIICRIGAFITTPGINGDEAVKMFRFASGGGQNLFQLVDIFSGGAFAQMTVIALGVMPYITSSIVMQILMAIIPSFQRDMKENPEVGKRKMGKWIRILTLGIAVFQSWIFARYAIQLNMSHPGIIVRELLDIHMFGYPVLFVALVVITMTTGSLLLMWIGEQITERGVGNGISLIISLGILSSLPGVIGTLIRQLNLDSQETGQLTFTTLLAIGAVFVAIIAGTILVIQAQRKIPLQYARRPMAGKTADMAGSYIPLKINYAGVIPVIFASSMLMFPATIAQFLGNGNSIGKIANYIVPGTWTYTLLYVALIFFFTYFWTSSQFRPDQIASDMKKNGAFIPGVRQGLPTQEYIETTMNRITFAGASFLAIIAVLPTLVSRFLHLDASISYFFGGTSLLILVGVILDTTKQIESHLLMKRYDGFMKTGRITGRT